MKSRIAMVASVLALTGLALAASACGPAGEAYLGAMATERSALIAATARSEAKAPPNPEGTGVSGGDIKVMYEVTGDANGVTVTLVNDTGGIDQGNYGLPLRYLGTFPSDTSVFSVAALIYDPTYGSPEITCRIAVVRITGFFIDTGDGVIGLEDEIPKFDDAMQGERSMLEFSSPLMDIALKVEAKASGFGNTATCLWENANN